MDKINPKDKLSDDIKLKIRNDFVQGVDDGGDKTFVTLDELIKKYNVAQSTVYRVARSEQWKVQKEQLQQEYLQKLDRKRTSEMAEEAKKFDNNSIGLAKALYSTIAHLITKNDKDIKDGEKGLQPTQINALANAAIVAQRLAKLALGEATHNINANINQTNDSFRRAMELLDSVEHSRSQGDGATH